MSWFDLPEPEKTNCKLCGRDANYGTLCEACREYLKVFDISAHQAQLEAERLTLELKQRSTKKLRGREEIEDSPLWGGSRQKGMFNDE